ncbi:MAG: radical SAM protein, partial [Anaerovoracaceae bacterium]
MKNLGLYVHIPFCIKKCRYCGFLSLDDYSAEQEKDYALALFKEIKVYSKRVFDNYILDTIYIGGGTPSIMPEGFYTKLMEVIFENFVVAKDAEISIEVNPKTINDRKLMEYKEAGINRLSIGAQAFHQDELDALGRLNTGEEFFENFKMA